MLPIEQIRSEVLEAVRQPGFCVLLSAPTGSGKSTRIPGMLLEAGWGGKGTIIVVQPRRLAARLLAGYVAREFPCQLGQEVGYTVRFDSRRSAATRILFVTDGILERRLTEDPELKGVSAVIFDEVHERRLSGDLCLARVLEMQRPYCGQGGACTPWKPPTYPPFPCATSSAMCKRRPCGNNAPQPCAS